MGRPGETKRVKSVVPDADHDYDLLDVKIGSALVYGERRFGINLVWSDPYRSDNVRFARQSGSRTPIKYGQQIAINIRGGGWLVYKKRTFGINLGWSDSPRYEWRIDGGDPKDNVLIPGLIALHNSVENDWLMLRAARVRHQPEVVRRRGRAGVDTGRHDPREPREPRRRSTTTSCRRWYGERSPG